MILNTKKPLKAIINIAVRGSYILYFCQVQSTNSGFEYHYKPIGTIELSTSTHLLIYLGDAVNIGVSILM
jgi:hypothetical protein